MKLTLSELLAQHRQREGLSQEEAAEKIGVSARQYSRWAAGKSKPQRDSLKKLVAALRIDPDELIERPVARPTTAERLEKIEAKLDRVINHLGC